MCEAHSSRYIASLFLTLRASQACNAPAHHIQCCTLISAAVASHALGEMNKRALVSLSPHPYASLDIVTSKEHSQQDLCWKGGRNVTPFSSRVASISRLGRRVGERERESARYDTRQAVSYGARITFITRLAFREMACRAARGGPMKQVTFMWGQGAPCLRLRSAAPRLAAPARVGRSDWRACMSCVSCPAHATGG